MSFHGEEKGDTKGTGERGRILDSIRDSTFIRKFALDYRREIFTKSIDKKLFLKRVRLILSVKKKGKYKSKV